MNIINQKENMSGAEQTPLTFDKVDALAKEHGITLIRTLADEDDVITISNLNHLFENLETFVAEGFSDYQALESFLNVVVQSFSPSATIEQAEQVELADDNDFWVYTLGTIGLVLSNDSTRLTIAKKVNFFGDEE